MSNAEHGEMMAQIVLETCDHVSRSFKKYLSHRIGFENLFKATFNMHESDNIINKIASGNISLTKEYVLVTMARFLHACCDNYWDAHCNIIRQ